MTQSKTQTAREFSAGGVVVRRMEGEWHMAAIQPTGRKAQKIKAGKPIAVMALPKGIIDAGESPEQTAVREVREETGLVAEIIAKLGDVKYVYVRSWGDGARVFKVVSFYLLRYRSGRLGNIASEMRIEVERCAWILLAEAPRLLTYQGDRAMAQAAMEYLKSAPALST